MDDKKKKTLTTQTVLVIRVIVGAYVMYLAYQIVTGDGVKNIPIYLSAALFVLMGGFFVVWSLYMLITGQYIGGKADVERESDIVKADAEIVEDGASSAHNNSTQEYIEDAEVEILDNTNEE